MAGTIFLNIFLQLIYYIGAVYAVGFLIALINRRFYGLFPNSKAVIYATGFIGTPIHEASHALMCLLFMHKIVEIKLFQTNDADGVLGYVSHTYNKKNIYAVFGNYFIGVAPILMGCGILGLTFWLLMPSVFDEITSTISIFFQKGISNAEMFFEKLREAITCFFDQVGTWQFWVFIIINLFIALHMTLSDADIKGSLTALPIFVGLIFLVNIVLGFAWPTSYFVFVRYVNGFGMGVVGCLSASLVFASFYLAFGAMGRSIAIKAIKKSI